GHDRRHSRIEDRRVTRAGFEWDDLVLQNFGVRVREARVDQVGALAIGGLDFAGEDGKCVLGSLRTFEGVSGAAEYRRTGGSEGQVGVKAPSENRSARADVAVAVFGHEFFSHPECTNEAHRAGGAILGGRGRASGINRSLSYA